MCFFVTNGRKDHDDCTSSFLDFHSSDLNSEGLKISATSILLPCIFGFLYQNRRNNTFQALLNHGRAYALTKALVSWPEAE